MDQLLGLVFLAGYIVGVISLAAAITYAVIRIFPTERTPAKAGDAGKTEKAEKAEKAGKAAANGGAEGQGRLYRRSRRRSS